jgi:hypothetical protein
MSAHLEAKELRLSYSPKFREYGIDYTKQAGGGLQVINFCPWCGSKLPSSLRDQWFEQLDRLGLEPEDQLPDKLQDDSWWRTGAN